MRHGEKYPAENPYGTNFLTTQGTIQAAGLRTDRSFNPPCSFIFHEKVHGIFDESGQSAWLRNYLTNDNPIAQAMGQYPELKQSEELDNVRAAHQTIDEALTTAFQGLYEEQEAGLPIKIRDDLYKTQPTINTLAHKLIPLIKEALKNGETFGPTFMKKVETEFMSIVNNPALMNKIREQRKNILETKNTQISIKELFASLLKPRNKRQATTTQTSPNLKPQNTSEK